MQAAQLVKGINLSIVLSEQVKQIEISNIAQDTRRVTPDTCFVCIKGSQLDGHDLVEEAIVAGATLIIAEKMLTISVPLIIVPDTKKALAQLAVAFYQDPSQVLQMIGVTGTNGKTSITHMLSSVLSENKLQTDIIGTMYNQIGGIHYATINTTPDSLTNQQLLYEMKKVNTKACAMEVSSHALVQGRVWGIDFDTAVFTNLTQDHLEYHHTMENYFLAKSLLFSQLGNSYHLNEKKKWAVINIDDPYGKRMMEVTSANVLTYGIGPEALIRASDIRIKRQGTHFKLHYDSKSYDVQLKMVGNFNVLNVLAVFGGAIAAGLSPNEIITSIEKIEGVKGRFQLVPNTKDLTVVVDYAHTPDGLKNVLEAAKEIAIGKVYCVVGCGGDRDPSKRPEMAKIAIEQADVSIFTADNPRTEDPQEIINQMVKNVNPEEYYQIIDREKAIHFALNQAQAGDLVIIAGKGHENYQIIGTTKHHFDDVEVVEEYLS